MSAAYTTSNVRVHYNLTHPVWVHPLEGLAAGNKEVSSYLFFGETWHGLWYRAPISWYTRSLAPPLTVAQQPFNCGKTVVPHLNLIGLPDRLLLHPFVELSAE